VIPVVHRRCCFMRFPQMKPCAILIYMTPRTIHTPHSVSKLRILRVILFIMQSRRKASSYGFSAPICSTYSCKNDPKIEVLRLQKPYQPFGAGIIFFNLAHPVYKMTRRLKFCVCRNLINLLAPELFFFNLAHPVYKMTRRLKFCRNLINLSAPELFILI